MKKLGTLLKTQTRSQVLLAVYLNLRPMPITDENLRKQVGEEGATLRNLVLFN